jgi:hypothetical protein
LRLIPVPDTFPWVMQNRVRLEIVDGPLKGKKFEFAEHDTFMLTGTFPYAFSKGARPN